MHTVGNLNWLAFPARTDFEPKTSSILPTSKHSIASIPCNSASHKQRFFATCAPGLEEVVAAELSSPQIAASDVQIGSAGVSFTGNLQTAYNANLWLRCAIRVLVELASSRLPQPRRGHRKDPIYEFVRESVDWKTLIVREDDFHGYSRKTGNVVYCSSSSSRDNGHGYFTRTGTAAYDSSRDNGWNFRSFAVQSRTHNCPQINNSVFASVRAKDAICDAIKDACGGSRPDPPDAMADVPLFLSIYGDHASLYRDMSGISLHRRGYRDTMHRASLNESIAAGILTIAGWNSMVPGFGNAASNDWTLLDPMCGSGTFLIEGALMACNCAPGLTRKRWPFQTWHDHDVHLWTKCWETAATAAKPPPKGLTLLGNDVHEGATSLCNKDAKSAGVSNLIDFTCMNINEYKPLVQPSLVVVNPPWGARLPMDSINEPENVTPIWQGLGKFLKQRCSNADVYVLCGNPSASRGLHMRNSKKWPITVGGIECKLLHYHVLPPKIASRQ